MSPLEADRWQAQQDDKDAFISEARECYQEALLWSGGDEDYSEDTVIGAYQDEFGRLPLDFSHDAFLRHVK